jgi:hypothetical protein
MHNPPPMTPTRRRRVFLFAAVATALLGCGSATDERPAKWSFISATITEPSCATVNCHSELARRGGVDLHDRATGYNSLKTYGFATPIDAADPTTAPVIHLMRAQGSMRMPPDQPQPEDDIRLIAKWIGAGANND